MPNLDYDNGIIRLSENVIVKGCHVTAYCTVIGQCDSRDTVKGHTL